MKLNIKSRKGFTLIELLVVIGILAVLAAIAIPTVAGLIDRANVSADNTNASEMTNSIERFVSEYELVRLDVASNQFNHDKTDAAGGRVYNSVNISTLTDCKALESSDGLDGKGIDIDTKYPVNEYTIKSILKNYMKTSSSIFEPKQSDCSFYYSPTLGVIVCSKTGSTTEQLLALASVQKELSYNETFTEINGVPIAYIQWINLTLNAQKDTSDWTAVNVATDTKDVYTTLNTDVSSFGDVVKTTLCYYDSWLAAVADLNAHDKSHAIENRDGAILEIDYSDSIPVVRFLKNCTLDGSANVSKDCKIDINGKKILTSYPIRLGANCELTDNRNSGEISGYDVNNKYLIYVSAKATIYRINLKNYNSTNISVGVYAARNSDLTMNNVRIYSESTKYGVSATYIQASKARINNCDFTVLSSSVRDLTYENNVAQKVSGFVLSCPDAIVNNTSVKLTATECINGGDWVYSLFNFNQAILNNCTFETKANSRHGCMGIYTHGASASTTLNNVTANLVGNGNYMYATNTASGANTKINGGSFSASGGIRSSRAISVQADSTVRVDGATLNAQYCALTNSSGNNKIYISNCNLTGTYGYYSHGGDRIYIGKGNTVNCEYRMTDSGCYEETNTEYR